MSKLDKIVEDLSSLTVLEAADLAKLLEEKWGVSAAAAVAVAGPAAGAAAPAAEAQTEFNVILKDAGDKKIGVIKVVRELNEVLSKKTPIGAQNLLQSLVGERGGVRTAVTGDQDEAGHADGSDSTRFFSPFSAVSTMTFSALRLIMPIIGIFTSTESR